MLGGERPSSSHATLTRCRMHNRVQGRGGVAHAGAMEPVPTLDYRVTSRRPAWEDLPAPVRAAVEVAAGGAVTSAGRPVTSGFSGGFAAVLRLADGRDVF